MHQMHQHDQYIEAPMTRNFVMVYCDAVGAPETSRARAHPVV
jgi:hypothetical protein